MGESDLQGYHTIILKMQVFTKKLQSIQKIGRVYIGKVNWHTIPEEVQTLDLPHKNFNQWQGTKNWKKSGKWCPSLHEQWENQYIVRNYKKAAKETYWSRRVQQFKWEIPRVQQHIWTGRRKNMEKGRAEMISPGEQKEQGTKGRAWEKCGAPSLNKKLFSMVSVNIKPLKAYKFS